MFYLHETAVGRFEKLRILSNSTIQYYNLKPTKYNLLLYSPEFALVPQAKSTAGSRCYIIEIS